MEDKRYDVCFVGQFTYRDKKVYEVWLDDDSDIGYKIITDGASLPIYHNVYEAMHDFALSMYTCGETANENYTIFKLEKDEAVPDVDIWVCEYRAYCNDVMCMYRNFGTTPEDAMAKCDELYGIILDEFLKSEYCYTPDGMH